MIRQVTFILLLVAGWIPVDTCAQDNEKLLRFEADPALGFHFPYYLYIPKDCSPLFHVTLLVEPNNTGKGSDSFAVHDEAARMQAERGPLGHALAGQLRMPLLVPVFPRPEKEWRLYSHMLDRDVMKIKKGNLKRIDLQLLAMINAAREQLFQLGYVTDQQVMMTGYSSSGVFVNRFAALHPLWVKGYAAGGINGLLMMPFDRLSNKKLNYPLGTADFKKIKGETFDLAAFRKVKQFIYMGERDTNDAVQFDDGYNSKERRIIFNVLGEKMIPDRWEKSQSLYKEAGLQVQFITYEGIGHEIKTAVMQDLVAFFRALMVLDPQH